MPFDFTSENERLNQYCRSVSITPTDRRLIVSLEAQQMALFADGCSIRIYSVSTSKNPPSCIENSFGTPVGLHALADKIGAHSPSGTVFRGRKPKKHYTDFDPQEQKANLITSRILRLRGLEVGKNSGPGCDSYDRYIYIHGTNHENRIGQPFSGGCIELCNDNIIELFDQVEPGDLVWITKI
jgi:hypothetical protein|tara:strand:+ start:1529 stop:2077 length:549 start_codon:yes stop_codon:yes gene_type:complete